MKFLWPDGTKKFITFGETTRGLNIEGVRPLNAYISPLEFTGQHNLREPIENYLFHIIYTLQVGGRLEIRAYDREKQICQAEE